MPWNALGWVRNSLFLLLILTAKISLAFSLSPELASVIDQAFRGQQLEISDVDFLRMESEFASVLKTDPDLIREAPAFAATIASLYLRSQRIQEAIWTLDRGGLYAEAEYLAQRYENFLKTAEIVEVRFIGEGVSLAKLITYANGMQAVLKPVDPQDAGSLEGDVWAYEFDRMGGFNLVPTAVKRAVDGTEYSLHGFVAGARPTGVDMTSGVDLRYPDLYLLDYLILNLDRHKFNSMLTSGERAFAIDHGRIGALLIVSEVEWYKKFDSRMRPSMRILQNLMSLLNHKVFMDLCERYAPKLDMSFVADRIRSLRNVLSLKYSYAATRPIQSALRLQSQVSRRALFSRLRNEDQERLAALEKKVLSRAKILAATNLRVRGPELNDANLSFWIDGLSHLKRALVDADFLQVGELNRQSQAHPELRKIFVSEFIEALDWYERRWDFEDVLRFKKFVLTQEDLLLEVVHPQRWESKDQHQNRYDLPFQKAIESPAFEAKLIAKIHALPDDKLKSLLLDKYRIEILDPRQQSLRAPLCRSAHPF